MQILSPPFSHPATGEVCVSAQNYRRLVTYRGMLPLADVLVKNKASLCDGLPTPNDAHLFLVTSSCSLLPHLTSEI